MRLLPGNVRAGQVISLVEVAGNLGPSVDTYRLAYELGADVARLIPILDTAEMLGLVKSGGGDVSLTELGKRFQQTSREKVKLLSDQIAKLEPFKTALTLAAKEGEVEAGQVAEALAEKGATWHHEKDENEMIIRTLLIHWGIYAGLLAYNKNGRFEAKKR